MVFERKALRESRSHSLRGLQSFISMTYFERWCESMCRPHRQLHASASMILSSPIALPTSAEANMLFCKRICMYEICAHIHRLIFRVLSRQPGDSSSTTKRSTSLWQMGLDLVKSVVRELPKYRDSYLSTSLSGMLEERLWGIYV